MTSIHHYILYELHVIGDLILLLYRDLVGPEI